jgi:hypothetical protein
MSTADIIAQINNASLQIGRYLSVVLLLFGTIGNLLCCLVLIQRTLRTSPCVMYFLIASISNIISLIAGVPPRMLSNWNILTDLTNTISILCKCRIIVLLVSRNISSWLLVFATIDRYLLSSLNAGMRQMSNMKQAFRWIMIICISSLAFWAESAYCFDANVIGAPIKCYAKSAGCRIFNDLAQSFVTTIIPSSVMLAVGLCTIANIRRARRIRPTTNNNTNATTARRTDSSLTRMLLVQVILLTIFNIPQAIQKFYLTYTFYETKSSMQTAIENLIFNIALLLTYVPNCIPFYIYILTSDTFRGTFIQLIRTFIQHVKCTRN